MAPSNYPAVSKIFMHNIYSVFFLAETQKEIEVDPIPLTGPRGIRSNLNLYPKKLKIKSVSIKKQLISNKKLF